MARVPSASDSGLGRLANTPTQLGAARPAFQSAAGPVEAAAGVGTARALQGLADAGTQAGLAGLDIATQLQIEANEREAKSLDLEYSKRIRELSFGDGTPGNPGYFALQGEDAVEGRGTIIAAMEKAREELASRTSNPRVREMFNNVANTRSERELNGISRHFTAQSKVANQNTSEARSKEFIDDAVARYTDDTSLSQALSGLKSEVVTFWDDQGAGPEVIEGKLGEATSTFHRAIVDRHLADLNYTTATAYFEANKEEIDGRLHSVILEDIARRATKVAIGVRRDTRNAIDVLNAGKIPTNLAAVQQQLAAVPSGVSESVDDLRLDLEDAIVDREFLADFGRQPLAQQAEMLATFRASTSATAEQVRQAEKAAKVHSNFLKAFDDGNGLQVAVDNGVVENLAPLNLTDEASLADRAEKAEVASGVYGRRVSPIMEAELDAMVGDITGEGSPTPPDFGEVRTMLNNVHSVLGEDEAAFVVRDLINKKHPEVALALQTSKLRPNVAERIIRGGRILRENPEFKPKDQERLEGAAEVFENLFTEDTKAARAPILAAAAAIYADRAVDANVTEFDPEIYEDAIREVVGGLVEHNGRTIIPPYPNMDQDAFDDLMDRLTDDDLMDPETGALPQFEDGSEFTVDQLRSSFWTSNAELVSIDMNGGYNILFAGNGYVRNQANDGAFVLNLRELVDNAPDARAPSPVSSPTVVDTESATAIILRGRPTPPVVSDPAPLVPIDQADAGIPSTEEAMAFIAQAEGRRHRVYQDTLGNPTVGVGVNLNRPNAREDLEAVGADYDAVLAGRQKLTDPQIDALLTADMIEARSTVARLVNIDNVDNARQIVLTDMAFNMGPADFATMDRMIAAVNTQDWETAALEAQNSRWFTQVGRRGPRNVEVLLTGQLQGF